MPDEVMMILIAHEMAHSYQSAIRTGRGGLDDVEDDALAIMKGWGFRDADTDDWSARRADERWRAQEERWVREWERASAARAAKRKS